MLDINQLLMKALIPFLVLFALVSCRKNKIDYSRIFAGDRSMVTFEQQKVYIAGSFDTPKFLRFDLDKDGTYDVEIESNSSPAMGQGVQPDVSIKSMHPGCAFFIEQSYDTVYFYETTQVQPDPNGTTASIHLMKYSCSKENAFYIPDDVVSVNTLVPLDSGARLDRTYHFESGKYYLAGPSQEATAQATTINDTTYYEVTTYKTTCGKFPVKQVFFIGLLLQTENGPKLGWLKLEYLGGSAIRAHEWGLQK